MKKVACLLLFARVCGLTADDLGLARRGWPAGLRWGAAGAAVMATSMACRGS